MTIPVKGASEEDVTFLSRMIEWDSHNHMILTWIRNTSIPSISNLLGSFDDAKSAWDMLTKRYSTTHGSMKYQLVVELHQLRQEPGQSINDYYDQLRFIWDQIDLSDPTWACSKDAQQYASIKDEFRLYEFLMSLHKDFEPIRGQLLNRSPAPSLDTAVNELVREEARLATLQAQNKLNILAITPSTPLIEQPQQLGIFLALAIVTSKPTRSSATIASVLATPLRLVTVSSGSTINLSSTELQEIIAQAVRMAGNASLSTALSVLPADGSTMHGNSLGFVSTSTLSVPGVFYDPRTGQELGTGPRVGRMFPVNNLHLPPVALVSVVAATTAVSSLPSLALWHSRLGHAPSSRVQQLVSRETFAPIARISSVRAFLAVAAARKWDLFQMDVKNAFLNGDLSEEVYMQPPLGLSVESNKVCHLRRALYGLKQAPRAWFAKFSSTIFRLGYTTSPYDSALFLRRTDKGTILLLLYVDDMIITGDDLSGIQELKDFLSQQFEMKDLGHLSYFLGLEITHSTDGLYITQAKYASDLLSQAGLTDSKTVDTPVELNAHLTPSGGKPLSNPSLYRRLVGSLVYLTVTRPDISYAVHQVSQYLSAPRSTHYAAVLRILRYLKGTLFHGLFYSAQSPLVLRAFSDSDWARDPTDRRSTTGYCFLLGSSLISWRSKKQTFVARSSTEAEYRALADTTSELLWLKWLLKDLGVSTSSTTPLYCDNQSAIHIAHNDVFHERTKHIEIDCHFIRYHLVHGALKLFSVSSKDQLADIFTKSLPKRRTRDLVDNLKLISHPP
ncbi:Retrovirus-related Pol polyprotein from transposon RE1 [Vitis vinifera]|uniref:Retrovirus-related Pol polyprotein from transposon RE1 n=1 Tax=Vitis vinifera TaxID=29760 RepID=A0A438GU80_VITVI|nr:Retrovirus-related Pol polyprotein from transposon RE1 [Vitis vinifera]